MNSNVDKNFKLGIVYGLSAYFLWGIIPVYWKQIPHVSAFEILANRFIWCVVFMLCLLVATGSFKKLVEETKAVFSTVRTGFFMVLAAIVITFNWGIFIWAVDAGRIVDTSMGYYINPLVSTLFGVVFFKERLNTLEKIAVVCASIGIGIMVVQNGSLPWISLSLALTFASYGVFKKLLQVSALTSITIETLLIVPLALAYEYSLGSESQLVYGDFVTQAYLFGAGAATAIPLLLFTGCAKLMPLNFVGFLQYIAPTMTLFLGVFVYNEPFNMDRLLAFGCIWVGLVFFIWSQIRKL